MQIPEVQFQDLNVILLGQPQVEVAIDDYEPVLLGQGLIGESEGIKVVLESSK